MQALRQILDVRNHSLNIQLPDNFDADKVEVIILPFEDRVSKGNDISKLRGKLKLSPGQYAEFQEEIKNSREGWEKNI